jgi:hypothetical protein
MKVDHQQELADKEKQLRQEHLDQAKETESETQLIVSNTEQANYESQQQLF